MLRTFLAIVKSVPSGFVRHPSIPFGSGAISRPDPIFSPIKMAHLLNHLRYTAPQKPLFSGDVFAIGVVGRHHIEIRMNVGENRNDWQLLYKDALLESDQEKIQHKIETAQDAIANRVEDAVHGRVPISVAERQGIEYARRYLSYLRKYPAA